jgi:hypothetical protein
MLSSFFFISQSVYRAIKSYNFLDPEYIIQFTVNFYFQVVGILTLGLVYKYRKKECEMFKNLCEIDELMENDLQLKIDYSQYKREAFLKGLFQALIVVSTMIFKATTDFNVYKYKSHELPTIEVIGMLSRIFILKYILYVDLMHFQMKVITIFLLKLRKQ